jgi:hypothetical protein
MRFDLPIAFLHSHAFVPRLLSTVPRSLPPAIAQIPYLIRSRERDPIAPQRRTVACDPKRPSVCKRMVAFKVATAAIYVWVIGNRT